ncbi:GNAT family N-acetyltransferase [Streptomyces sp. NPDC004284]|uniref:GNAT family N-acetyltransferase n=1 Tax=Streptomyces sp. NPDC004284 TaxID=3364695 RepID=UPI0036B945CA
MTTHPLLREAQRLWEELARAPRPFPPAGDVDVIVSPRSELCPAGWVGVVALGGSALVTVPDGSAATTVRAALAGLPVEALRDAAAVRGVLPVAGVLGPAALSYASPEGFRPAALSYASPEGFRPATASSRVERLPGDHPALRALEAASGQDDSAEASLDAITSPAFVAREDGRVVAAAGYRAWPRRTAHLCVLTAPEARGRGLARTTASEAVAHALAAGLLPQWRARSPASRRVAAALGFEELGAQLSFEIAQGCRAAVPV